MVQPGARLSNTDVMQEFGVGQQGGMRRSRENNCLVIVSDHTKSLYQDRWDGYVLHYTGMGTKGDQALDRQNRVLAESGASDIAVHLLEVFTPGEYIYAGEVELTGRPYLEEQLDVSQQARQVYMFPVRLKSGGAKPAPTTEEARENERRLEEWLLKDGQSLEKLRGAAERSRPTPATRSSKGEVIIRNPAVSAYVKRAAQGCCDLCQSGAPFHTRAGEPYLECHHIHWLAHGGEDTISNAVALCPNCHRKMHALDRQGDKKRLRLRIARRDF